ncbi:MAG: TIR domain-containing protein [Nevskia sp.]
MDAGQYKYRGFISYSHQDRRWGEWLHRALERYRVPARLAGSAGQHGEIPKRLFPIFRDRDELPTAGALADALRRALQESHSFVLVCSPAAAASRGVNEEVLQFKRLGGEDRILCLIVDGEPNASDAGQPERECFPPALRFRLGPDGELSDQPAEPLAADARASGDGRDNARLKIIAGLLGVSFGELRQRDLQARNRRLGIVAAITTGVAALTVALAVQALLARRAAEKSRQQGEDLIGFMLGDLRAKLEPLGKLDILDAVGDQAMGYFDGLDNRNLGEAALTARAKALRQIGDVRFQQGRPADAAQAIDAALTLNRELARRHPADADLQFELGQTEFWVGFAAWRAQQLDRAEKHWDAYQKISRQLVDRDPENPKWQTELAYSESNLGSLAFAKNEFDAALDHFRRAAARLDTIEPQTSEVQTERMNAYSWQGTTLQVLGRPREAIQILKKQVTAQRELLAAHSNDKTLLYKLAATHSTLGFAALAANDIPSAQAAAIKGLQLAKTLRDNDSTNRDYRYLEAAFDYIVSGVSVLNGDWPNGTAANARSMAALQELREQDQERTDVIRLLARSWEQRFALALHRHRSADAGQAAEAALALCAQGAKLPAADRASDCARARLLAWELSAAPVGSTAADEARRAVEALLDSLNSSGDRAGLANLRARVLVLAGDPDAAAGALHEVLQHGYLPLDLHLFLLRHCQGAVARLPELACSSTHAVVAN